MADCECLDDGDEARGFVLGGKHIQQHIGAPKWRHVYPDRRKFEVRGAVLPPPHCSLKPTWRHPHGTREQLKEDLLRLYNDEKLPVDIEKHWVTPLNLFESDPLAASPGYTVGAVVDVLTIFPALLWGLPKPDQDIDLYVWPEDAFGRGHTIVKPGWLAKQYPTGGVDPLSASTRTLETPKGDEISLSSICCEVCFPKHMPFAPAGFGPWCPPIGHDIRVFGHLVLDMSHDFQTELHPLQWLTWRQEAAEPTLEEQHGGTIVCYRTAMFADVSGRFPLTRETIDDQSTFGGRQADRGEQVAASITYEARDLAPKLSIGDPTIESFLVKADSYDDQIQPPNVKRAGDAFLFTATVGGWAGIEASNCNRTERDNNQGGYWDGWVVFRKPPRKPRTSSTVSPPETPRRRRWLIGAAAGVLAVGGAVIGLVVSSGGSGNQQIRAAPGSTAGTTASVAAAPSSTASSTAAAPGGTPPARVTYPAPITAYFDQSTYSTYYSEPKSNSSWSYTWSLKMSSDPACAAGFRGADRARKGATWFHADENEGGPCNHSGKDYNEAFGHPGMVTLVVRPKKGSWACTMKLYGTAPHNQSPSAPKVGRTPQCTQG